MAIVSTPKRDFSIVCESGALLNFVKERTIDGKFKIGKEGICGGDDLQEISEQPGPTRDYQDRRHLD